jgi:hypothetical protein
MASTSETGHAKNVANFENLISFCSGYGTTYNPSKANLKVAQLQAQLTACKTNVASVVTSSIAFNNAVNARIIAFAGIKKLSTRLINALDATGATPETVKTAKSINAKVQGSKKAETEVEPAAAAVDPNAPVPETDKTISTSQQSYTSIVEHFSKLIALLTTETAFIPNENELKVATLNTLLTNLRTTNTAVINAYTAVSNARIARNTALYNETAGLCIVAKEVKMYIKSLYGATSPQYKQVSALEFKTYKK